MMPEALILHSIFCKIKGLGYSSLKTKEGFFIAAFQMLETSRVVILSFFLTSEVWYVEYISAGLFSRYVPDASVVRNSRRRLPMRVHMAT